MQFRGKKLSYRVLPDLKPGTKAISAEEFHVMERIWSFSYRHKPFASFTAKDHLGKTQEITSLSDIRKIEHDSEIAAKVGAGQQIVFRAFSQDHSNRDAHSIMKPPEQRPKKQTRRGMPIKVGRL